MRRMLAPLLFALALGCGGAAYHGTVTVTSASPDLLYVAPGIQVIADYDEPIFYADGMYWWFVDGSWYRSAFYTGGWVSVVTPPIAIVTITQPHRYRHYRPTGWVGHRRPVPAHQVQRPIVRDHRSDRRPVRDHRR
jgi:hypothetical protein